MAVVNFRTDDLSEQALAELTADGGRPRRRSVRRWWTRPVSADGSGCARRRSRLRTTRLTLPRAGAFARSWIDSVRGDVHRLRALRNARGAEQQGSRFAVVIQSDDLPLSTLLVAPTSRSAAPRMFRPTILVADEETQVLVEQTTAVAPDGLGELVGHVGHRELEEIDSALRLTFALD